MESVPSEEEVLEGSLTGMFLPTLPTPPPFSLCHMKKQGKVTIYLPGRVLIRNQPCWHLILIRVAFGAVTVKFCSISHQFHGISSWRLSSLRCGPAGYVFPFYSSVMSFVLETDGQILSGAKAVRAIPTSSTALAEGRGEVIVYGFPYSWQFDSTRPWGPLGSPSSPSLHLPSSCQIQPLGVYHHPPVCQLETSGGLRPPRSLHSSTHTQPPSSGRSHSPAIS